MNVLRTLGLVLALATPPILAAQPGGGGGPIVTIIPAGGTYTTQNVGVTVEWCSERPFAEQTLSLTLNGQDVRSNFNTYPAGVMRDGLWCIYGMRSDGAISLSGTPEDDYILSATIEDIESYFGGDGRWFYYRPPGWQRPTARVSVEQSEYVIHNRASGSRAITFRVTNEGSRVRTSTIASTCSDAVASCPVSPTSVWLDTAAA